MRKSVASLVLLVCLLNSPTRSSGDELIRLQTTVYELPESISDNASQAQLAKAAESLRDDAGAVRFDATSTAKSGSWLTAKNNEILLAPSAYVEAKLYRGTTDEREYSIDDTGPANSPETFILPSQPTELKPIELGTTFHLKPTRLSNAEISLEGSWTESVLVDLAETNENPVIYVSGKHDPSKQIKVSTDSRLTPVTETQKVTFNNTRLSVGKTHYALLRVKPSCLSSPLPPFPEKSSRGVTTRVYSNPSQENETVQVYPPRPDEEVRLLVAVTPEIEKVPTTSGKHSTGKKLHLSSRFIELDSTLRLDRTVHSETQFQHEIRHLNQEKGVDLLSAPSVITPSGKEASVQVVREFIYPNRYPAYRYDPEMKLEEGDFPVAPSNPEFGKKSLGAELFVTPRVLSTGMIELESRCVISDFKGFIRASNPAVIIKPNLVGKPVPTIITENQTLFALFSRREQETTLRLSDAATVAAADITQFDEIQVKETGALGMRSISYLDQRPRRLIVFVKTERLK